MTDRASYSELATALAFILQKWKDTGADPVETKPFDDLLARVRDEPPPPPVRTHAALDDESPRRQRKSTDPRLAALDAEIDRLNRETD